MAGSFGKAVVESCRIIHSQVLSAAKSKVGKCVELNELYVDPSLRREEFCIDDDDISKEKAPAMRANASATLHSLRRPSPILFR